MLSHPYFLKEAALYRKELSWIQSARMIAEELKQVASPDETIVRHHV